MNWDERQRKKLFKDYSSGKITAEKFDEMAAAIGKVSDKKESDKNNKISKYRIILSIVFILTSVTCFLLLREAYSYYFLRNRILQNTEWLQGANIGNINSNFVKLCREGSSNQIIDAVEKGANVNIRGGMGLTPLMAASANNNSNPEAITALIMAGALINAQDLDGSTPLIFAAKYSTNPEVVKALHDLGADPNVKDNSGKMAIDYMIENEKLKNSYVLFNLSDDISLRSGMFLSTSEFIRLCQEGDLHQINNAILYGANVNARDSGLTPLMAAAGNNADPEVISALIKAGADVKAKNVSGRTPLLSAAMSNSNPEVISALIKAGADVNEMDADGRTPLMTAASDNHSAEVITALINLGALVNAKNTIGRTPLLFAARNNSNLEVITALIKAGADVNVKDADGKTPLIMAASNINPKPETIVALISVGADVNTRDKFGLTPLMAAVGNVNSNPEVITAIIKTETSLDKAGVDVNAQDENGKTPLMEAALKNPNPEVITTLLQLGADPKVTDNAGKMALDYARENNKINDAEVFRKLQSEEFAVPRGTINSKPAPMSDYSFIELCKKGSLLQINEAIQNGANVHATDNVEMTTLMAAARENPNSEVIATLIKSGANVNAKDARGVTPLMFAAGFNSKRNVITTLLQLGADPKAMDASGNMAEYYARRNERLRNTDVIRILRKEAPYVSRTGSTNAPMNHNRFVDLCKNGTLQQISDAIANGANVNARDNSSKRITPLMAAAQRINSNPEVIRILIRAGAEVNARDSDRKTPLIIAADNRYINPEVITTLLRFGAKTELGDRSGKRAIDYARTNGRLRNTEAFRQLFEMTSLIDPVR